MTKKNTGLGQPTYDHLLRQILTGQLQPGERIPEVRIAKEFGTSRTPVRDALRQLANEGLVTIYPNRYAEVTVYDDKAVQDIGTLRMALDAMAVKLAALYGSQADFLELEKIAQNCYNAMQAGDYTLRRKYDSDFHLQLATLSRNNRLIKFQNELYLQVQFIMLHRPNAVSDEPAHLRQHFEIADALMNHDEKKATVATLSHIASFYNLREKYPADFFGSLV